MTKKLFKKMSQYNLKQFLLMTTKWVKMSSKTFLSIAVIREGWSCFGKVIWVFCCCCFSSNRINFVSSKSDEVHGSAGGQKIKGKQRLQRQTAHLIAQLSVEVMCKILFRWMGRIQSITHKICTERYMNTQTPFLYCTLWCNRGHLI